MDPNTNISSKITKKEIEEFFFLNFFYHESLRQDSIFEKKINKKYYLNLDLKLIIKICQQNERKTRNQQSLKV